MKGTTFFILVVAAFGFVFGFLGHLEGRSLRNEAETLREVLSHRDDSGHELSQSMADALSSPEPPKVRGERSIILRLPRSNAPNSDELLQVRAEHG